MNKVIRIGTRDSQLALWQASTVQKQLAENGVESELVPIKSTGDLILDKPLYELGITGVFTKSLDVAMLNGTVDIAVHSMKDVPTLLPKGIVQTAVLKRGNEQDILLTNGQVNFNETCTVATGSLRRKAQWLNKYPTHNTVDLRGNVNTRLRKLKESDWQGAIFAKAGLERIGLLNQDYQILDWMIPAPAQGAMVIVALEHDSYCCEKTSVLNDPQSALCTQIERDFLRTLEGGCTAPIGAHAQIIDDNIQFKGVLLSLDGQQVVSVEEHFPISEAKDCGIRLANDLLSKGGREIMEGLK